MIRTLLLLCAICAGGLLVGCKATESQSPETVAKASDLIHHRYELMTFNDLPVQVAGDVAVEISFGENMHITGKACNRFSGQGSVTNGVLKAPRLASTRMFCAEEPLNQLEAALFGMLEKGVKVALEGDKLILRGDDTSIVYARRDLMQ